MTATKIEDTTATIARLRHLITQRDLVERTVSAGVSFEENEDGNMTIVVACPLPEDEKIGDMAVVLRMTEAIGTCVDGALIKDSEAWRNARLTIASLKQQLLAQHDEIAIERGRLRRIGLALGLTDAEMHTDIEPLTAIICDAAINLRNQGPR